MRINESLLRQLIREELTRTLSEGKRGPFDQANLSSDDIAAYNSWLDWFTGVYGNYEELGVEDPANPFSETSNEVQKFILDKHKAYAKQRRDLAISRLPAVDQAAIKGERDPRHFVGGDANRPRIRDEDRIMGSDPAQARSYGIRPELRTKPDWRGALSGREGQQYNLPGYGTTTVKRSTANMTSGVGSGTRAYRTGEYYFYPIADDRLARAEKKRSTFTAHWVWDPNKTRVIGGKTFYGDWVSDSEDNDLGPDSAAYPDYEAFEAARDAAYLAWLKSKGRRLQNEPDGKPPTYSTR